MFEQSGGASMATGHVAQHNGAVETLKEALGGQLGQSRNLVCQCQRLDQLRSLLLEYLSEERRLEQELQRRHEILQSSVGASSSSSPPPPQQPASASVAEELESLRSQLRARARDYQAREEELLAACDPVQVLDFYEFKLAALSGEGGGAGGGSEGGRRRCVCFRRCESTTPMMIMTASAATSTMTSATDETAEEADGTAVLRLRRRRAQSGGGGGGGGGGSGGGGSGGSRHFRGLISELDGGAAASHQQQQHPTLDRLRRQMESLNQAMSVFTEASQQFNSLLAMEARLYDGEHHQDTADRSVVNASGPASTSESVQHSPGCPAASRDRSSQTADQQPPAGQHQQQHLHRVCEVTIAGLRAALEDAGREVGRRSAARTEEVRQLTFELRALQSRLAGTQAEEAALRTERRRLQETNESLADEAAMLRREVDRARADAAESDETERDLRASLTGLQADKAELLAGLEGVCAEKNRLHERLSCLEVERARLAEEAAAGGAESAALRRERAELGQRIAELEVQASQAEGARMRSTELLEQLKQLERRVDELTEARDQLQETLDKSRSQQSQRERDYHAALEATSALEESLAAQKDSVARLGAHSVELERQKLQLTDACVRWSDQHAELTASLEASEARVSELTAERQQLAADKEQLKARLDDLTDAWDEVRGEVESGYGARARLQSELREAQAEAATWRASCLQLEEERRGLEQRRETLEMERGRLQMDLAGLRTEMERRETAAARVAWECEQTDRQRSDLLAEVERLRLLVEHSGGGGRHDDEAVMERQQQLEAVQHSFAELSEKWERTLEENSVLQGTAIELRTKLNSRAIRLDQCMAENAKLRDMLRKGQGSRMSEYGGVGAEASECIVEEKNRQIHSLLAQISRLTALLRASSIAGDHQVSSNGGGGDGSVRPATPGATAALASSPAPAVVGWRGGQAEQLRSRVLLALVEALQAEVSLKDELAQLSRQLPTDWQEALGRRAEELRDLQRRLGEALADIELAAKQLRERGGELSAQLHSLERENSGLRERLRAATGWSGASRRRGSAVLLPLPDPPQELLLHAVCRLDDFELLRKEGRENLKEIRTAKGRVDERIRHYKSLGVLERSQSVDYSLLKHLAREIAAIQFYAEERERLLTKFWVTELPPNHQHHRYYHGHQHKPDLEVERWKGRYAALKEMLEQRLSSEEAQMLFAEKLSSTETLLSFARHNLERAASPADSAYTVSF